MLWGCWDTRSAYPEVVKSLWLEVLKNPTELSLLSAGGWTGWSQEISSYDSCFMNLIFLIYFEQNNFIREFSKDTSYLINSDVKNPEVHFLSFQ